MLCLLAWLGVAFALDTPIERAVDRIDRLYLHRDDVDAAHLLHAAAREVAARVHWLVVEPDGKRVVLRHGDGRVLGEVQVRDMNELPRALRQLSQLVAAEDRSEETSSRALQRAVLQGMSRGLDRYSRVLVDDRIAGFSVRLSGTESGVGVLLHTDERESVFVESVVPQGPADKAGLQPGDRLVAVDGVAVRSVRDAEGRLRGVAGSAVLMAVERSDEPARAVSVRRARVVVPNVRHRVLPGGVGYVHIEHVSQRTVQNLVMALDDLDARGALDHGLVVDLRNNTGGSMKEAARVADLFVSEGLLLRTAGRDGGPIENLQHEMVARKRPDDLDVPVVLVVNDRTASGAEILTGALVEHGRAAVVGQRTYGKGTVQKPLPLGEGLQLNLTVAHYVLLHERRIGEMGIAPDVWVGHVDVDERGVAFRDWPAARASWQAVVPAVGGPRDVEVELARRAVLTAAASASPERRATVLDALSHHAERLRIEGRQRLGALAREANLAWATASSVDARIPDADVELTLVPLPDGGLQLGAEVISRESDPLPQVVVQLRGGIAGLDGVGVAVGDVPAGGRARGVVAIDGPVPGPERLETVEAYVRSPGRPVAAVGRHLLTVPARGTPTSDGPDLVVMSPGLAVPMAPLTLPVHVGDRDGVPIHHVVVWANGRKVGWYPGDGPDLEARPVIGIARGPNRVVVEAVDADGRTSEIRMQLLGINGPEPAVSMDATGSVE